MTTLLAVAAAAGWAMGGPGALGGAGPLIVASVKAQIDEAARGAGFPESDYPYYSPKNGCGPDGWRNRLIPDLSHVVLGCDFSGACDRHDADYMTVGISRDEADERFRLELHASIVRYVEDVRARLAEREASGESGRLSSAAHRAVDAVAASDWAVWGADRNFVFRWWGWTAGAVCARGEVWAACREGWDAAKETGAAALDAATVGDAQVDFMHWEADVYYEAVRRFGLGRFQACQSEQARYDAWVREFIASGR